jgi:hypothetical protein
MACPACGSIIEIEEVDKIQESALKSQTSSLFFWDGGHTDFAIHSFENLRAKFEDVLHPHHHVLFNSWAKLMNGYMKTSDFVKVKFYCERIVNAMDAGPLPKNVRPSILYIYFSFLKRVIFTSDWEKLMRCSQL